MLAHHSREDKYSEDKKNSKTSKRYRINNPVNKLAGELDRHFSNEEVQNANKK